MYPGTVAKEFPDKPAHVMAGSGEVVTYKQLDDRSNQIAQLLRDRGLQTGDVIAICMENNARYLEIVWGAQRAGLYYTCISSRLTHEEVAYIVNDCGARLFFTSREKGELAAGLIAETPKIEGRFVVLGDLEGHERLEEAMQAYPEEPIADEAQGQDMLYSSGTTGRPKGVKPALTGEPASAGDAVMGLNQLLYGATGDSIYLSPAPLYHAAPLRFVRAYQRLGATVIVMEHFDPVEFLKAIEKYQVTHTQVVPTMFVRMLKLPAEERAKHDVSSLKCVIHAAAPCPIPVKEQMIEWWGPIINEYYAGTEGNGFCACNSEEWLAHKGSVGKPLIGTLHILDDEYNELPVGEAGTIYFESPTQFEYHNDPEKTKGSRSPQGWTTLGDIGYVDADGFLYLTDRKANMIISGGVNIYPQEIENVLTMHPKVVDVAVFGVPNEDFGEEVKAVVQPREMSEASDDLARELIAYCKEHLAGFKCPRSVEFMEELPRHPTGKLYKRLIRDKYWTGKESRIV
ncbi:MAG: AMP-binding protein [Acidimicrobiia bacterium]